MNWIRTRPSFLPTSYTSHIPDISLHAASEILPKYKLESAKVVERANPAWETLTWRLDLRRVVLASPLDAGSVKQAAEGILAHEELFECEDMLVEVLVASEEVKKVVEEVVREWEQEKRRTRCRVVMSS